MSVELPGHLVGELVVGFAAQDVGRGQGEQDRLIRVNGLDAGQLVLGRFIDVGGKVVRADGCVNAALDQGRGVRVSSAAWGFFWTKSSTLRSSMRRTSLTWARILSLT